MADEEEGTEGSADEDRVQPEIVITLDQMAGVWANWAHVTYARHEFTIDFARIDPVAPVGVVVARISGSSAFVMELIDKLNDVWQHWARRAMPPETGESNEDEIPDNPVA